MPTRRPFKPAPETAPIIGATGQQQQESNTYQLERIDPKTRQRKTAYAVFRDQLYPGQTIRWGSGAHWTVLGSLPKAWK